MSDPIIVAIRVLRERSTAIGPFLAHAIAGLHDGRATEKARLMLALAIIQKEVGHQEALVCAGESLLNPAGDWWHVAVQRLMKGSISKVEHAKSLWAALVARYRISNALDRGVADPARFVAAFFLCRYAKTVEELEAAFVLFGIVEAAEAFAHSPVTLQVVR